MLKGFCGTSEWLLACHNIHVKILHLFQQDVPSHVMQASEFSFVFTCGDFYIFEIWCFSYLLGIFLIHFRSVWPLCRNQPIDLNYLLMAWFLNNGNAWLKWVKENLTGGLDITTVWKPCVREMFLFLCNMLSFCFNGMFSLIYIKGITSPLNIKDGDPCDNG